MSNKLAINQITYLLKNRTIDGWLPYLHAPAGHTQDLPLTPGRTWDFHLAVVTLVYVRSDGKAMAHKMK